MSGLLKSCPFCGNDVERDAPDDLMEKIFCPNCGAHTLWSLFAIEKWNKRTQKDTRLKPCPMCGNEGKLKMYDATYEIQCTQCLVSTKCSHDPEEVISAWNRRTNND